MLSNTVKLKAMKTLHTYFQLFAHLHFMEYVNEWNIEKSKVKRIEFTGRQTHAHQTSSCHQLLDTIRQTLCWRQEWQQQQQQKTTKPMRWKKSHHKRCIENAAYAHFYSYPKKNPIYIIVFIDLFTVLLLLISRQLFSLRHVTRIYDVHTHLYTKCLLRFFSSDLIPIFLPLIVWKLLLLCLILSITMVRWNVISII